METKVELKQLWSVRMDALDSEKLTHFMRRHPDVAYVDDERYGKADYMLLERYGRILSAKIPMPDFSPKLRFNWPAPMKLLPDFFDIHHTTFCSRRLRAAFALPPQVIQYIPLHVATDKPAVRAMDYQAMRVLAGQPLVDLRRSQVKYRRERDRFVGGNYIQITWLSRLEFREDFVPQSEMLHSDEEPLDLFATDALAKRVMKAGCLGIEFRNPSHVSMTPDPLIRTAKGVERRSPATRRAHLRLVERVRTTER